MRRLSVLLLAGLTVTAVGCSDDKTVTTAPESAPATSSASVAPEQPSSTAPTATPSKKAASVGDTLGVRGMEDGESLAVTVVKVVDPAGAANEFSSPDPGTRFVAVQFRLKNTGTAVYSDSPSNGARLVDAQGQQFDASSDETTAGPDFPGSVTIAPGDTGLGFVAFEVPVASKPAKVQFTMASGFADDTGQWNITR
ncbi:DUF4352 domain-containing protein [Streptomyces antibioticus]|uniref:DUF4352 domain-containing protein n=1 Tax=Streptomyces antibioticus TaxID=1890 RepID=UPI0036984E5A